MASSTALAKNLLIQWYRSVAASLHCLPIVVRCGSIPFNATNVANHCGPPVVRKEGRDGRLRQLLRIRVSVFKAIAVLLKDPIQGSIV